MRAQRGKRSEAYWPSLVMKKWLNIKPRENEFSEDDFDAETESEDETFSCKESRFKGSEGHYHHRKTQLSHGVNESQTSGNRLGNQFRRHRRGISETPRCQYIDKKDVRVTIGTWNVAGRTPSDDLDIQDWICMKEPADIYILGFQEVVPLNAGNVLGAEDNRPIQKWESLIRKSLNKTVEPESNYRSLSAPPSPIMRSPSTLDALAIDIDIPSITNQLKHSFDLGKHEPKGRNGEENKALIKRIYGIDGDRRLDDWPTHTFPRNFESSGKLRRALSSSERVKFSWLDNPLAFDPNFAPNGDGLKLFHSSVGKFAAENTEKREDSPSEDEEEEEEEDDAFFDSCKEKYVNSCLSKDANSEHCRYVRIVSKQMVGIYISVWVRKKLRRHISNLKVSPVGVGLMGYMGNKGSISVSMSLYQSRLCFVCSHLSSGHKDGDQHRRNSNVYEILRRTRFSSIIENKIDHPRTIPCHDQIFWFGDLNYRLDMVDSEIRNLVAKKQWNELINKDQLNKELRSGCVFDGWKEGQITFPPTYKYEINSDRYVGENPKEGEKKRSPAWCDRILWSGKSIKQHFYRRAEIRLSDHRPVSSSFSIEVEVLDTRKLQRTLHYNTAAIHPDVFADESHCQ